MRICLTAFLMILLGLSFPPADAAQGRAIELDDLDALRDVSDPQISPDGEWVAYVVGRVDAAADVAASDLWMSRWDGNEQVQLTRTPGDEYSPRWAADGRRLAFLAADGDDSDQVWILDLKGGEPRQATRLPGGVRDFAWSPDGEHLVLVGTGVEPMGSAERPVPIVIDRFQFKADGSGYLAGPRPRLFLAAGGDAAPVALTVEHYDALMPAWSPGGDLISFVTKRGEDPDRHSNWDVYVIEPRAGAEPRRLSTNPGIDADPEWGWGTPPVWSPDGRRVAYLHGGDPALGWFALQQVGVVPAAGGEAALPTASLDRNTTAPQFSPDGATLYLLLEDDQSVQLARVPVGGGPVERLTGAGRTVYQYDVGPRGRVAVLASAPTQPAEVFALEGDRLRPLSRQNDALIARLELAPTTAVRFASADGTVIHGLVVTPAGPAPGRRHPTLLRLHGGPVAQHQFEFDFEWQLFAAHGYAVVAPNPRGSSGRGAAFQRAIFADWGNVDVADALAAADWAVESGLADPRRLGVGGWSYGAMLTNYVIATDTRFRAATSGAGISNMLAGYGTDAWVRDWEIELGLPWENTARWLALSYPFMHAQRITTPTLFLCGENDVNVPLLNSEQMYQALRRRGVDSRLVVYPGEGHGIARPSFRRDVLQRYLDWYARHIPE